MDYKLHPSKYIARIHGEWKFRPKKPGDWERAHREMDEFARQTYWALTKKHGRRITGEGVVRVKGMNRLCMTTVYAFYDQSRP